MKRRVQRRGDLCLSVNIKKGTIYYNMHNFPRELQLCIQCNRLLNTRDDTLEMSMFEFL